MTTHLLRLFPAAFLAVVLVLAGVLALPASAQAATPATGTLTVQLVTPAGSAWKVKNVTVSARSSTGGLDTTAKTTASGVAIFAKIPGGASVTVQAQTWENNYEYTATIKAGVLVAPGKKVTTKVTVAKGAIIEGTATLSSGGAFKYGQVVAVDSAGNSAAYTSTDGKGNYSLRGLTSGSYAIQFNGRNWADSKTPLLENYGWSYYGGGSLQASKKVTAKQATASAANSVTKKINGTVPTGPVATISLAQSATGGQLNVEKVSGGKTIVAETVYSPVYAPGTSDKVRLNAGTYRLTVVYPAGTKGGQYFYTGPGKTLSKDLRKAVLFTVGAGNVTVTVGKRP